MNSTNLREKKGITLIALVVTVVLLIILSAITINLLVSDNGILKQASSTKEKQEVAGYLDKLQIAEGTTAAGTLGEVSIEEYLKQIQKEELVTVDNTLQQTDGSYQITTDDGYVFGISEPTKGDIVIDF